jgi:hypothetical protein
MYEGECNLFEIKNNNSKEVPLGHCHLKILIDEDFGARIIAIKDAVTNEDANAEDDYLCNHFVAMQTTLDVDKDEKRCSWSALDFSADHPTYRSFVATFTDLKGSGEDDAQKEFVLGFIKGKELAEQSVKIILQKPNSGGTLIPDNMYCGQGAELDEAAKKPF